FSYIDMHQEVDSAKGQIITRIKAKALPRIYTQIEPQGLYSPNGSSGTNIQTGSQRSFGLAGIASLLNRNIMGNGGSIKISSITSYEAIFKRDKSEKLGNAFQQGFNLTLSMPNFRLFEKINVKNQYQRKNTVFSLSYQYEENPNFSRTSLPASISFQFIRKNLSWYYTPLEISFNRNNPKKDFNDNLAKFDKDFLKRVFTNQFISASKIGGIYSNNRNNTGETYFFGRMGIETSGNLHRMVRSLHETNFNSDTVYKFLGVDYFQYTKIESEIRIRRSIDNLNSVAFRTNFGIAIPYGNSKIIPYDKRYFIGGSTSLRGWRPRRLGPGNTPDTAASIIDRSGEFTIETNLEYRFTLIKNLIESALFLDAGNIWNLSKEGSSSSGFGVLTSQNFLEELALNTGIGFRFNWSLFVFRVDWGFPIRDPGRPLSKRWVMTGSAKDYFFNKTAVAIGIGYPF
ncbi:MAG: BamA/TamA family outer membrane protein, partial [Bacteroidetes bacterium]|nr:BamA/TamA family outer membrane protein [Bacteroidota bacterium]